MRFEAYPYETEVDDDRPLSFDATGKNVLQL